MKNNYLTVGACLFLSCMGIGFTLAQSTGPEFLDCNSTPISLCVSDDVVRLPSNNKIYLGEENPDASSCSVHVSQKTKVRSTCGQILQYEVQLFLEEDSTTAIVLKPLTSITTDSLSEAELNFDSELSPDNLLSKNGIPYSSGCNNYHRIKWMVTDSCGDGSVCEQKFHLYDCSKPLLSDLNYLYTIRCDVGGQVNLKLDSILKDPKDDCTYNREILYSLYPDHYKQDSSFSICDVPAVGVEFPFDIWIADNGVDSNCDGIINWTERNVEKQQVFFVYLSTGNIDCNKGDPFLYGNIETEDVQAVEKVEVTLASPEHSYPIYITGQDGKFNFGIPIAVGYTLNAYRNDFHRNGVSTLDLVRIKKHLLGIEELSSPYDVIAADANNNQKISVLDLVELRKLILGIYTELPDNKSWRFVPDKFIFQDTLHPWPFPETITFNGSNAGNIDFVAIKIGDVNNSVKANAQSFEIRTSPPKVIWSVNQIQYFQDDIININFYVDNSQTIRGFQFTVSDPDLEFLGIATGAMDLTEENIALFNDKMTLSWFNEEGFQPASGDILFTIKARAKRNGDVQKNISINSDITEAEQYGMNDEILKPVLRASESKSDDQLILFAPEPNPWREKTIIPFELKESGTITFELFDLNGSCVYRTKGNFGKGKNEITLSSSDFTSRGLMYYTLKTTGSSSIQKMIVLD
ncbi:MAG: dockerin type I domain-containing protein [Saprospiraceae bacterium]